MTRYSSTSLAEAMNLLPHDATDYAEALASIVREENKPQSASGR